MSWQQETNQYPRARLTGKENQQLRRLIDWFDKLMAEEKRRALFRQSIAFWLRLALPVPAAVAAIYTLYQLFQHGTH
jgi:hypothetical protein